MLTSSNSPLHSWRQEKVRYHPACIGGIESDHQCCSVWTRVVLQTQQTHNKVGQLFHVLDIVFLYNRFTFVRYAGIVEKSTASGI